MFQWPLNKIEVINSALAQTGDQVVAVADDGSDEWTVGSPAYERALAYMMENHGWSFARTTVILQPAAVIPGDIYYDTAYNLPPDLVHLVWARVSDLPADYSFQMGKGLSGEVASRQLVINSQGGPPAPNPANNPAPVTIQYISQTASDPTFATPMFVLALTSFVMSGIYRGLHSDPVEADKVWMAARQLLNEAKTRHDQERPKRAIFNSRLYAARRIRRPWPQSPQGWGGTGQPG